MGVNVSPIPSPSRAPEVTLRLSIATKISLAFSMMVIVFTIVIMASIWRTQQLFGQIQALNQSIIPLSLILLP